MTRVTKTIAAVITITLTDASGHTESTTYTPG